MVVVDQAAVVPGCWGQEAFRADPAVAAVQVDRAVLEWEGLEALQVVVVDRAVSGPRRWSRRSTRTMMEWSRPRRSGNRFSR